jgi:UDP-N-acetyl-2-amino-2-deoxyglucuronate dehydrogenase
MAFNFAISGVGGFVAPRHLAAIRDTGHNLVAALDPHDAVGVLDKYAFDTRFFTEYERFDRHLEKLRRGPEEGRVHYLSICSPNYLHDAHIRLALRIGAHAICEKPLVINPWNLDALEELESESSRRVHTILQLRLHPALIRLREELASQPGRVHDVSLTYVTGRGRWYQTSWKGAEDKSGGVGTNIGIHFFDMLIWLFGEVTRSEVHVREATRMAGSLELARARVQWFLSTAVSDLPFAPQPGQKTTFRSIVVDGVEVEFSDGFTDLHTKSYQEILDGRGFRIADARPSIELTHRLRQAAITERPAVTHPAVATTHA